MEEEKQGERIGTILPPLAFMGTPDFAVPTLRRLIDAKAPVRLVVTQPDRPSGRGRKMAQPPVKTLAAEYGIPVYQPVRTREPAAIEKIKSFGVECAVVVAFGQILPRELLDVFKFGALNVHASLLPRYRGAAPIHRAIMAGEEQTGISIMLLDSGMDTGPVLSQQRIDLKVRDTYGTVIERLSRLGSELLFDTLVDWIAGRITAHPQDDALATYAPPLGKEEFRIDWNLRAKTIINCIRAFDPWPGAFFFLKGRRVKAFAPTPFAWTGEGRPGEVAGVMETGIIVIGGDRLALVISELQMEGQRRMSAREFARGRNLASGTILE